MKFRDSASAQCRYGERATELWGDWELVWENSSNSWQGEVDFIVYQKSHFVHYTYDYGSCSYCDAWENAAHTDKEIEKIMENESVKLSFTKMLRYCDKRKHGLEMVAALIAFKEAHDV